MRQNLKELTGGETRLIGGSSDTLYIPSEALFLSLSFLSSLTDHTGYLNLDRLLNPFTSILDTFLQTNCFLEIALPTVVHLILPKWERILFVDHVSSPVPKYVICLK